MIKGLKLEAQVAEINEILPRVEYNFQLVLKTLRSSINSQPQLYRSCCKVYAAATKFRKYGRGG